MPRERTRWMLIGAAAIVVVLFIVVVQAGRVGRVPAPPRDGQVDRETTPPPTGESVRVVAVGDICEVEPTSCAPTAALVRESNAKALLTLGDNQYESGSSEEFRQGYDPTFGRFREITKPVAGNHEWNTPNAQGYRDYFDVPLWYSFDIGSWHVVALDSSCADNGGCRPGTQQYEFLEADLAADDHACVLAYWHHPRFSSGVVHGGTESVRDFWDLLAEDGADLILNGHEHQYERFAPLDAAGNPDPGGIRQFVVGTGKFADRVFSDPPVPNSEVRITDVQGVLELDLRPDGYSWRFVTTDGPTDSGSGTC